MVTSQASSSATIHKIYLISLRTWKTPLKAKSFQNTATYRKLGGGDYMKPSLLPRLGYEFACTSEGKKYLEFTLKESMTEKFLD